jgi:hypothetical protein
MLALLLGTLSGAAGCRRFSGSSADLRLSPSELKPGEKREVEIRVYRHWDTDESFRLDLEPPPDVTITPTSVEFKSGREEKVKVLVEVKADAAPGVRRVKQRTTPDVHASFGADLTLRVVQPGGGAE